ncbi:MAG: hypothetical protein ACK5L3_15085 [Oscillospiraceae bacterium]
MKKPLAFYVIMADLALLAVIGLALVFIPLGRAGGAPAAAGAASPASSSPVQDETAFWTPYTLPFGEGTISFKLPSSLSVTETGEGFAIVCSPDSELYPSLQGRDGALAGVSPQPGKYVQITESEYDVPEVGQYLRYTYATTRQPLTFYYAGEYIVFVSGASYYNPTEFYNPALHLTLWVYAGETPETTLPLFEKIAATLSLA